MTTNLKIAIIKGRDPRPTTHELFRSSSISSIDVPPPSHGHSLSTSVPPLEQQIVFDQDPRHFANVVKDLVVRVYKVDGQGKRKDMTQEVASGHRKLLFGELLADNEAHNTGQTDNAQTISSNNAGVHHNTGSPSTKHTTTSITRQLREDKGNKKKIYDNLLRIHAAVEFAPLAHQKQQLHNQINQTNRQVLLTRVGQSITGYMHERTFEEAYVWALSYVNNNTPEVLLDDLYALINAVKRHMLSRRGKVGNGSNTHEDAEKDWEDILKEGNHDDRQGTTMGGNGHTTTKKEKKRHLTLTQKLEQVALAGNKKFEKFIGSDVGHAMHTTVHLVHGKKSNDHGSSSSSSSGGRQKAMLSGGASSDGSPRVDEKGDSRSLVHAISAEDNNPEESMQPLQLEHDGVTESKTDHVAAVDDADGPPSAAVDACASGNDVPLVSPAETATLLLSAPAPVPQPPHPSLGAKSSSHKRRSGAAAISRRTTTVSAAPPSRTKEESLALGLAWGAPKAPGQGLAHKQAVEAAIALEERIKQKVKGFGSGSARCKEEFPWKSILNAEGEKKTAVPVQVNRLQREEKAKEMKEKGIQEYSNLPRDFIAGMEKQLDEVYGIFESKIDYFIHDMENRTKRVAQHKRKFQYLSKKAEEASVVVVQHCSDFQKMQAHQRKRALHVVEDKNFTRPDNMRAKLQLLQVGKMPEKPLPKRPQSAPALLAGGTLQEGGARQSIRGGALSRGMSSRSSLVSHGSRSSSIAPDGHTTQRHAHLRSNNSNRAVGLETSIIPEDDEEESETVTNIESYLAAMRQMNELAVATAEERFSSLRRPSHQQQQSSHEHPPPPSPPANATAASTANPATASPKGKGKGKGIATTIATTVVDAGEFADAGGVGVVVTTADSEVVHAPILVDVKTLSDKALRRVETDTLSPLLGESILAAWGDGEAASEGMGMIDGSSTHNTDTAHASSVSVKEVAVSHGKVEVGVEGVVAPVADPPSSSITGVTKKKKSSSSLLMSSSPSVQSQSPSLSPSVKTAPPTAAQGVCRLEMEMIRRQVKHRQSNHHLTAVAQHLWFVSYVLKLQESTSLSHQEIPPSCLRFLGIIHRLLTHGFAQHLDVVLFYRIVEDTVVDLHDYPKPLVHRTLLCVAEHVHVGPEAFIAYLEERKITPCSELLAQVREIKDRRERHRKRKEKEKRLSSDHLNEMARVGSKHKKRDHRTGTNTTSQDNNSSPESVNPRDVGVSRGRMGAGGSGVWMVGSPESPDDHDNSASDSNRNSPTSSGRPSPTAHMFRTRSGWSGSLRDRDSSPEGGDRDSPETVGGGSDDDHR